MRALRIYLHRTTSLSQRPRSLFVSPCAPTHPLSKNTLSFFIHSVILRSLSSPPSSTSSVRAHSICAVATSAFARNVSLSTILEAATWGSSTVFTSFYLRDVQFTSSNGFSLGLLVAADAVVYFFFFFFFNVQLCFSWRQYPAKVPCLPSFFSMDSSWPS